MKEFQKKVELLVAGMSRIDGVACAMPAGTFYVFPSVAGVCNRLGITSHGLALYLLEGADDTRGVACLGGECFGDAGRGFLRLSCAQPDERIAEAFAFMAEAFKRKDRVNAYLASHDEFRLNESYEEPQTAREV
jgi:aspartate aminotransferase